MEWNEHDHLRSIFHNKYNVQHKVDRDFSAMGWSVRRPKQQISIDVDWLECLTSQNDIFGEMELENNFFKVDIFCSLSNRHSMRTALIRPTATATTTKSIHKKSSKPENKYFLETDAGFLHKWGESFPPFGILKSFSHSAASGANVFWNKRK